MKEKGNKKYTIMVEDDEVFDLQERICSKVRTICSVEVLQRLDDIVKRIYRRGSR